MESLNNPYLHMPKKYLQRRIRQYDRNLKRIVSGKAKHLDFNANRALLLTFSEALSAQEANKFFDALLKEDTED